MKSFLNPVAMLLGGERQRHQGKICRWLKCWYTDEKECLGVCVCVCDGGRTIKCLAGCFCWDWCPLGATSSTALGFARSGVGLIIFPFAKRTS